MQSPIVFNGYQITLRPGLSFDATVTGIASPEFALPEGLYTTRIGARSAFDNPPQPMVFKHTVIPLASRAPLFFAFGDASLFGLKVDPAALSYISVGKISSAVEPEVTIKVRYAAPWMRHAFGELGQREVPGVRANPRILSYFKSARFWGTDDSGGQNAWCASFVSWVMEQSGYGLPAAAYRARSWASFGQVISRPVFGAIGVKSRRGGGHVAFVVGQSDDGKDLFMLGGNQSDEVNISRYPRDVWTSFCVPSDYDTTHDNLPVYRGESTRAGGEA